MAPPAARHGITPIAVRRADAAAPRSDEGGHGLPGERSATVDRFSAGIDVDGLHRSGEPRGDGGAVPAGADVPRARRRDARRAPLATPYPRTHRRPTSSLIEGSA